MSDESLHLLYSLLLEAKAIILMLFIFRIGVATKRRKDKDMQTQNIVIFLESMNHIIKHKIITKILQCYSNG
ncbi:MAG: hypothetical protein ACTHJ7_05075 [Candidatus Nitrosocosmicus sp.]